MPRTPRSWRYGGSSRPASPRRSPPAVVYLEHLTGSLFLESEEEVRRFTVVSDHLRAEALGTGQSIDLIAQAIAELG